MESKIHLPTNFLDFLYELTNYLSAKSIIPNIIQAASQIIISIIYNPQSKIYIIEKKKKWLPNTP